MAQEWVLIDREALLAELAKAFDPSTAEVLLAALNRVVAQTLAAVATHEDVQNLERALTRLAEAQRNTDQRIAELAEAQRQTDQRIAALTERTDQRFAELVDAIDRLRKQVGGLSDNFGGDIEDAAVGQVYAALRRELGWEVGMIERGWETWDGEAEEIDFIGTAKDPARPDTLIWIVGEAKHNLTTREVGRFVEKVGRARRNLRGEVFPVVFCYRARPEVQEAVLNAGLRMVFSNGKLV